MGIGAGSKAGASVDGGRLVIESVDDDQGTRGRPLGRLDSPLQGIQQQLASVVAPLE